MNILFLSCGRSTYFLKELHKWKRKKKKKLKIVTADSTNLPTYLNYTYKNYLVKKTKDLKYLGQILKIIKLEKIDYIMPFNDFDLKFIINNYLVLKKNCKIFSSNKKSLKFSINKFFAKKILKKINLKSPKIHNLKNIKLKDFPLVAKKSGSKDPVTKGFHLLKNLNDLNRFKKKDQIYEQFINGTEYTTDVLCDFDSNPIFIIPRIRISTRSHVSEKGLSVYDKNIISDVKKIIKEFKIVGLANMQCIKMKNKNYWTDINLRISGGVPLFIKSANNFFDKFDKIINKKSVSFKQKDQKYGIYMSKYDEPVFFDKFKKNIS